MLCSRWLGGSFGRRMASGDWHKPPQAAESGGARHRRVKRVRRACITRVHILTRQKDSDHWDRGCTLDARRYDGFGLRVGCPRLCAHTVATLDNLATSTRVVNNTLAASRGALGIPARGTSAATPYPRPRPRHRSVMRRGCTSHALLAPTWPQCEEGVHPP